MAEGGVEIQQPVQESAELVKEPATTVDNWFDLFHRLGQARPKKSIDGVERSLNTRVQISRYLGEFKSGTRIKKAPEIHAAKQHIKDLDAFDRQFLNRGRFSLDMPGLGIQEAQYAIIELPNKKEAAETKPPIFVVPALAADLNGTGPLVREAARTGRTVIIVGYPESFRGRVTTEFAQALEESSNFEPYTTFFKKAIEALVGKMGDLELWGYSVGGGILTEILQDPNFQERVTNAVIIAPGGCVDQSKLDIKKGLGHEAKEVFLRELRGIHDTAVTYGLKQPLDKIQKKLRDRIVWSTIYNKVGRRINSWDGMRVREGGKIIVATGRKDEITKSYRVNDELVALPNDQLHVLDLPGSHVYPETHAESMVGKIAEIRDNPSQPKYQTL